MTPDEITFTFVRPDSKSLILRLSYAEFLSGMAALMCELHPEFAGQEAKFADEWNALISMAMEGMTSGVFEKK